GSVIAAAHATATSARVLAQLGVPVRRITSDSRSIAPGDAFAAYPGEVRDGRSYIPDALRRGAGSVLWDDAGYAWPVALRAPNAGVANLKHELGWIADNVFAHPSARLWMVGVTGTNGKTS